VVCTFEAAVATPAERRDDEVDEVLEHEAADHDRHEDVGSRRYVGIRAAKVVCRLECRGRERELLDGCQRATWPGWFPERLAAAGA
jgi:hypothetical protein